MSENNETRIKAQVYGMNGEQLTVWGTSLVAIARARFGSRAQLSPRMGCTQDGICGWDVLYSNDGVNRCAGWIEIDTGTPD